MEDFQLWGNVIVKKGFSNIKFSLFIFLSCCFSYSMQENQLFFYKSDKIIETPLNNENFLSFFRNISEYFEYPTPPNLMSLDSNKQKEITKIINTLGFYSGWVGFFGYELHEESLNRPKYLGKLSKKPQTEKNVKSIDSLWFLADQMLIFDHLEKKILIACLANDEKETIKINKDVDVFLLNSTKSVLWINQTKQKIEDLISRKQNDSFQKLQRFVDESFQKTQENKNATSKEIHKFMRDSYQSYVDKIKKCQEIIKDGDSYELCLTTKFKFPQKINDFDLFDKTIPAAFIYYLSLRKHNPAPFGFYFHNSNIDLSICSSSPEEFLKISDENDGSFKLKMKPIKGTCCRNLEDKAKDEELKQALLNSEKERSENLMVINLFNFSQIIFLIFIKDSRFNQK